MGRREFLQGATALALGSLANSASGAAEDLVLARSGTLPILLTAPHGGQQPVPGVSRRDTSNKGKDADRYNTGRDPETDRIALGIAAGIKAALGADPYLVLARFDRMYIDANRPPEIAYDNPAAKPVYDLYHQSIRTYIDEIRGKFKEALLIDVHGQHKISDSLVRGTLNGKSVSRLVRRGGFEAVTGPKGMFGLLEKEGFKVFPSNNLPPVAKHEDGGFNGGYTTMRYGSHQPDGVDAFQFEIGLEYRKRREVDRTITRATNAIVAFYNEYFKKVA